MFNDIAQIRAYRRGVVHTTLNPEKPGAVQFLFYLKNWKYMYDLYHPKN